MKKKNLSLNLLLGGAILTFGTVMGGCIYKLCANLDLNKKYAYNQITKKEYSKKYKIFKDNCNRLDKGFYGLVGLNVIGGTAYIIHKKKKKK